MDAKHTPGPWRQHMVDETLVVGAGGSEVAHMAGDYDSESEWPLMVSNALLIAAAPELLEALIWMVENDETNEGDTPMPDQGGATWNEINAYWIEGLNRARAAIAKATGEKS